MMDPSLKRTEPGPPSPSQILEARREKLARLRESGVNPYPASSPISEGRLTSEEFRARFGGLATGGESPDSVRFCGRLTNRREMGKASFAHVQDFTGKVQIYVRSDAVGDAAYRSFTKDLDLGDILGTEGRPFRTKTGELSIRAEKIVLLTKSLRPLPEKWHGLKDVETRARQRELDLISNPESREVFLTRSRVIACLRSILSGAGYLEVETPMMQPVPGGAVARPFETFHNALGTKFYLRVAPELYLKRCLVGGFEKVFEIGRVFRNEGIDTLHNPEFTILEAYESYGNMESMVALTENLVAGTAEKLGMESLARRPFQRKTVAGLFREHAGADAAAFVEKQDWAGLAGRSGSADLSEVHKAFDRVFTEKIAPNLAGPVFVTDFPVDFSPLAKRRDGSETVAERFELYIGGEELANAYSELNDPEEQRTRLEAYRRSRVSASEKEESEGMGTDAAFLAALEQGMPPAGGLGIGVDRLVMLFTRQGSIRNVLLFPTLRPEKD